jgi:DNA-binding NtrC family response regulator
MTRAARVPVLLICADEVTVRLLSQAFLAATAAFDVVTAPSAREGLAYLARQTAACLIVDDALPDGSGLACLKMVQRNYPTLPVVMLTASDADAATSEYLTSGATDYVIKHGRKLFTLSALVEQALRRAPMRQLGEASPVTGSDGPLSDGIVGTSQALTRAVLLARRAACFQATVLIRGETGTGKELLARVIHRRSERARGPFVAQNCAALSETLLESELFGHVRGAFTGAEKDHRGLFEQADGGTLFLDEVGEMSPPLQAKLLRVLQDGQVKPVGGSHTRTVNARVIAATNYDVRGAAQQGRLRADLYYRLCVFPINLPPLRERAEDIRPLVHHFLALYCRREGKVIPAVEPEAMALLVRYGWPGNARELENEVHRLVLLGENGKPIPASLLSPCVVAPGPPGEQSCAGTHGDSPRGRAGCHPGSASRARLPPDGNRPESRHHAREPVGEAPPARPHGAARL